MRYYVHLGHQGQLVLSSELTLSLRDKLYSNKDYTLLYCVCICMLGYRGTVTENVFQIFQYFQIFPNFLSSSDFFHLYD